MCEYTNLNKCVLTNEDCPFLYWCEKRSKWMPSNKMPANCKVKLKHEIPLGQYCVIDIRRGYLYVEVEGQIVRVKNPYNYRPKSVKMIKGKEGWGIEV